MTYTINRVQSDSNDNIFLYEKDGKKVPLNSLYSPKIEAERFLQKISALEKHFIIIIGYGNGEVLEQLLNSDVYKNNTHFLFIEPYYEVKCSDSHQSTFNNNPTKLSFIYYKDLNSTIFARFLSQLIGVPASIQIHPNYLKTDELAIKNCLQIINEGIKTQHIINSTEVKFAVDWIVEPLLNIDSIAKSLNIVNLKGKFKGERAALIASGPSLKVHMDFLEQNKGLFHIFSAGSALKALLVNGIEPDYVLSLDSSDVNYESHFKGVDYNGTLIFETMSNSNIQKQHRGPLIVSRNNSDYITSQNFINLHSFHQSSPSVTIFALQVIEYLGFSEVFLVGQDLALVNGDYYA
ncbi:motility associated factor glycosyltransferase family protein, partial [Psychrobacillus psychrotolerans]|uniref:motility associated factor glycosyltransferase family protein n=1 Tax=Psychrobacillus psychrotolerans TaxID=126156 RepID=UPI003C776450